MLGLHAMPKILVLRRASAAWLLALALACAAVAPALAADSDPSPAAADEGTGRTALTPGPPSTRFT